MFECAVGLVLLTFLWLSSNIHLYHTSAHIFLFLMVFSCFFHTFQSLLVEVLITNIWCFPWWQRSLYPAWPLADVWLESSLFGLPFGSSFLPQMWSEVVPFCRMGGPLKPCLQPTRVPLPWIRTPEHTAHEGGDFLELTACVPSVLFIQGEPCCTAVISWGLYWTG